MMKKILISIIISAQLLLAQSVTITYNYDNISRLKTVSYTTGQSVNYTYDTAGNITNIAPSGGVVDSDGDGVADTLDAFPNDPTETKDSDNDGYGDNSDAFPNNPNEWEDLNNNGIGDNTDNAVTFNIDLNEGWNLISLPAVATVSIAGLNNPDIEVVRSFQNEQWYTWTSNDLSTSDQSLVNLQNGYGYWIKATNNTVFSVSGAPVTGSIDIATDGKWHMAGSAQIDSLSTFFDNHRTVVTIWKYVTGEWLSVSRDIDIQETMNDANITRLHNVSNIEGFMYKGTGYDQGPLLMP